MHEELAAFPSFNTMSYLRCLQSRHTYVVLSSKYFTKLLEAKSIGKLFCHINNEVYFNNQLNKNALTLWAIMASK